LIREQARFQKNVVGRREILGIDGRTAQLQSAVWSLNRHRTGVRKQGNPNLGSPPILCGKYA
jgi:hypothetical protein